MLEPGKKIGHWTLQEFLPAHDGIAAKWHCVCVCGKPRDVNVWNLINSMSKSCGCQARRNHQVFLNNSMNYRPFRPKAVTVTGAGGHAKWTIDGVTKSPSEWCIEYKINYSTVKERIRNCHWGIWQALTTPLRVPRKILQ